MIPNKDPLVNTSRGGEGLCCPVTAVFPPTALFLPCLCPHAARRCVSQRARGAGCWLQSVAWLRGVQEPTGGSRCRAGEGRRSLARARSFFADPGQAFVSRAGAGREMGHAKAFWLSFRGSFARSRDGPVG